MIRPQAKLRPGYEKLLVHLPANWSLDEKTAFLGDVAFAVDMWQKTCDVESLAEMKQRAAEIQKLARKLRDKIAQLPENQHLHGLFNAAQDGMLSGQQIDFAKPAFLDLRQDTINALDTWDSLTTWVARNIEPDATRRYTDANAEQLEREVVWLHERMFSKPPPKYEGGWFYPFISELRAHLGIPRKARKTGP